MARSPKGPPSAVVGLDIGSDSIKVVEAKYAKDGITITGLGIAPLPQGVIENDIIVDPKALGAAIKSLLAESGIKTRQCVSAVTGQSNVIVRVIEVPRMDSKELAETMKWEVERHVPFSPAQSIMDFQPIERPNADPNSQNMEVLLAVAQDVLVNSHVEALLAAGLKPMAIDIQPLAVSRALIDAGRNGVKEEVVAIVNIGARNTDLGIYEQGILVFPSPPLGVSGATLTQEIAEAFGETPENAETLKKEYASVNLSGFAAMGPAPGAAEPPDTGAGGSMFFAPGFGAAEQPAEAEPSAGDASGFQLTVDGPVFGEPTVGPAFDLGGGLGSPGGPAFDTEAAQSDGSPAFDLGGEEPAEQAPVAPVFDLDDEATGAPEPQAQDEEPVAAVQPAFEAGSMEDKVFQAVSGSLIDLANDIRRSLEYYATRYGRTPERLFLCGGTAKIPHLDEFLSNELGLKVEVGDPVANLRVKVPSASDRYLHEISPMLAVGIGLAIRDMVG